MLLSIEKSVDMWQHQIHMIVGRSTT